MDSVSNQSIQIPGQQVQSPRDGRAGAQSTDADGLAKDLGAVRLASPNATTANEGITGGGLGLPPELAPSGVFKRSSPHSQPLSGASEASLLRYKALEYLRKLVSVNGIGGVLRKAFADAIHSYVAAVQLASAISGDDAVKDVMFGISEFDESERLTAIRIFADGIPKDGRNFGNAECLTWLHEIFPLREDVESATKLLEIISSASEVAQAKEDVWSAVRTAVTDGHDAIMPESFLALTEEGRRRVAKLTVDWVLKPINNDTPTWFFRFTRNSVIRPYLKETVSPTLPSRFEFTPGLHAVGKALRQLGMVRVKGLKPAPARTPLPDER